MLPIIMMAAVATTAAPPCAARDVTLAVDARDGDFDGMSHSGTYLVARNKGRRACRLPGLPTVTFYGDTARAIPAMRQAPLCMHPGPVILPVTILPGGSVTAALRWVSGPVFDRNDRLEVQAVGMTIAGRPLRTMLRATLYGRTGERPTFSQAPLAPLPPTN